MIDGDKSRGSHADFCFDRITDISIDWLKEKQIKGILLDIDNTLTLWSENSIADGEMAWIESVFNAGIQIRLLSNRPWNKRKKVVELSKISHVDIKSFKPASNAFIAGLNELKTAPDRTLMVGDIVFTDIIPANKLGIWTALIEPLGNVDFPGTKVWRILENVLNWRQAYKKSSDFRKKT